MTLLSKDHIEELVRLGMKFMREEGVESIRKELLVIRKRRENGLPLGAHHTPRGASPLRSTPHVLCYARSLGHIFYATPHH